MTEFHFEEAEASWANKRAYGAAAAAAEWKWKEQSVSRSVCLKASLQAEGLHWVSVTSYFWLSVGLTTGGSEALPMKHFSLKAWCPYMSPSLSTSPSLISRLCLERVNFQVGSSLSRKWVVIQRAPTACSYGHPEVVKTLRGAVADLRSQILTATTNEGVLSENTEINWRGELI